MAANSSQGIDKGGFGFGIPGRLPSWQAIRVQDVCHEDHQAEHQEQARGGPSNGRRTPVPLGAEAKMSASLFKGDLAVPAKHVPGDDLQHGNGGIGAQEGKRRALAAWIVQKHPTNGQWSFSIAMP
jgi:hypothetical protein